MKTASWCMGVEHDWVGEERERGRGQDGCRHFATLNMHVHDCCNRFVSASLVMCR